MAARQPAPKAPPAKFAAAAQPQAPAKAAPPAAVPAVPPGFAPFVPAAPKTAGLMGSRPPADHFVPRDPPQATAGVRQDPPADRQQSVPDDPSLPMGLNQPLNWQPFANVPK